MARKHPILLSLMLGAAIGASAASPADINSPDIDGYLERGRMMWADRNYEGCVDQMANVLQLGPSAGQAEEARWYMALSAMGMDDDAALSMLREWMERYPASPRMAEARMAEADILFASGAYAKALEAYASVDAKALTDSQAATLTYRQGYSELMLGHYDKADACFERLTANPEYRSAAQFYLGYTAYVRGDYARALGLFEKVDASEAPGNAAPYYMAQIYYVQGDNRRALEQARRAIASALIPEFTTESKRIAGEALYALGDRDGAVSYLWDYAANATAPVPSAYYILGLSEWDKGDWRAAGKLFQQATAADDAMGQSAWLYLGQTYLKEDNVNSALMAFEKAFSMNHDPKVTETAFYNYAVAKSNGGRAPFETSAAVFMEFLDRYPSSRYRAAVEQYVIDGYLNDNQPAQALAVISKIDNPDARTLGAKQRALLTLGADLARRGDYAAAIKSLTGARAISEGDPALTRQAILWEGDCEAALGNADKARSLYERFVELAPADDPNLPLALYDLGYAQYAAKEYADASATLTRALNTGTLEPRMGADARSRLADMLYYDKKYSSAAAQYRRAAELSPATADYPLYQAAVMKGLSGDRRGQVTDLDDMMARFPDSPYVPDALLEKAQALAATGSQARADEVYATILDRYPLTAQGRRAALILAIDKRTDGDTDGAVMAYKQVITAYPSAEEARVAADDLKSIMADRGQLDEYVAFMRSVPGAPEVEMRDIDTAAFRAAEKRYLDGDDSEALLAYVGKYPGGVYEADALYYLAENAEDRGALDDAVRYARRVVTDHPTATVAEDAMVILARGQLRQGNPDEALDTYRLLEKSASTPSNLLAARMGIMTTSLRSDDNETVIATADKVLAGSDVPTAALAETRFMRGLALHRTGRIADAEKQWREVAADPADVNGARSAVYLAQSILDRGEARDAETSINRMIDANPPHPYWLARGFIVLSDALRAQGKTFEANQYLTTLKSNYPGEQPDIFIMIDERLDGGSK